MRVVRYRPRLYNVQGGQLKYRDRLRCLMLDLDRLRVGLYYSRIIRIPSVAYTPG